MKKGVKSLGKKSFNNSLKGGRNETETTEAGSTESPGRISDVTDTPWSDLGKKSANSSKTCSPKPTPKRSIATDRETANSSNKQSSAFTLKRKSDSPSPVNFDNEDLIQNSPPRHASKKAKLIFKRCFQTTVDSRSFSQNNDVEVEDSGEEN